MFTQPSSLSICAAQCPCGAVILHVSSLPCYFWLLKQQRTNILFSHAQLVQEKSVRYCSAAHFTHLSSLCGTACFWQWLTTRTKPLHSLRRNRMDILHELTLISQTPWALRVETYPLEQSFTSKTPPPFSCDLLFIYLYWKADISELQTRDTSGSSLWKSQPWKPEKWKANISTSILAGFRPQLMSCQSYIFLH